MNSALDRSFLKSAYLAAHKSGDPSTQNGACLVRRESIPFVQGWNHIPAHLLEPGESMATLPRELKYQRVLHAEKAAIYAAGRIGLKTQGATLYCIWYACPSCADVIIAAGISRVVGHRPLFDMTPARWNAEVQEGSRRLRKAGVVCDFIGGPIDAPAIRFDGRMFNPKEVFVMLPQPDAKGVYKFDDGARIYRSSVLTACFVASFDHKPLRDSDGGIRLFAQPMDAAKALAILGLGPGASSRAA